MRRIFFFFNNTATTEIYTLSLHDALPIKYGHLAHVGMSLGHETVVVTVDDEGPGIPADQRQAMLEPFNRLETSRNRSTGGAGLGLAVVRSLVEAHGGTIEIAAAPSGGARVIV